ncbi:QacE family quaternary ammonium compound efflux SMR transporter [Siminovitchia acidinfaciens]|uniref:QacE family quaternary ammonium compound efflux SMR transporter n=1 Tax=Siminovitchia acidinfaciens TaxID=2321395 RepID=A0A429XU09_9BACI|nr:SMR family transporter [Siminovitchia acidinfaciens]RST71475.1 QacE family quaternary ammonium compound efflux SMR transporter [Siminovitchia acidinfaciens]VEF49201.1 small multidrug resistance protein [Bacillus freudenreichii]
MAWTYVLFAAIVEVFWVIGLRYSETLWEWLGTIVAIIFSFFFIIKACEKLPAGTVYAVFTGSGAAAIVLIDFLFFGADFSFSKVLFIALIIIGVVGIKITTDGLPEENAKASSIGGR